MTTWGTLTIGGISFREGWDFEESDGGRITIAGSPTPTDSSATARAKHRSILGLRELSFVPVTFSDKTDLSGFYRVDSTTSTLFQQPVVTSTATWQIALTRLGSERDVEFESRVPTISRATEVTGTASFWHAPPVGFTSYYTGATVPTASTSRTSADGVVTVYRGIPNAVLPRWTVATADYLKGSARLLFDDYRHVGLTTPPHAAWELSNGLVRVASDGAGVALSVWAGGAWKSTKSFRFGVGGVTLTPTPEATVLRADPEECVLRLSWAVAPGRVVLDLALRRGSVFVTGVMKRHAATSLAVLRSPNEAATTATGGLRATSVDADGNRYVIGSSRTVVADTTIGALTRGGSTTFDFFLGYEVGATPGAGNAFADLFSQYLGTASERVRAVRR